LNVLPLSLPALRDHREDIPDLAMHVLSHRVAALSLFRTSHRSALALKKNGWSKSLPSSFTPAALEKLMNYSWPGNVRELESTIARALLTSKGDAIDADDLPITIPQSVQK